MSNTITAAPAALRHATPAFRTFSGPDSVAALGPELARHGCRRAVIVCGEVMLEYPEALGRVTDAIGDRLVGRFDGVIEHSPIPAVEAAAAELARLEADAVIAFGGGSPIVTARAATILLAEQRPVRELCTQRGVDGDLISPKLLQPKLPIWVVPSTPITAYAKAGSAVRDPGSGERLAMFDPKTRAQGVFFDPVVALTAPLPLVKTAAVNAFSMATECLQASVDPLADALLMHALRLLTDALPRLEQAPEDGPIRVQLMLGALLAGQGSDYVGGGLAQALAHSAGPRSSTSNGIVEGILLPHTTRFIAPATPGRLGMIADALQAASSSEEEEVDRAVAAIARFLGDLGIPHRLRDVDLTQPDLIEVVEHTVDDWTLTRVPRTAHRADLLELLEDAW